MSPATLAGPGPEASSAGADCEVRLALEAMATRFELVLHGPDPPHLRAAGEEALEEIARLGRQLSFYSPSSDVTWINAHAADGPVTVEPRLFALLQRCCALSTATDGAFDITIAPLMRAWKFTGGGAAVPRQSAIDEAREHVGFQHLELDAGASTVRFGRHGMSLDLGAAGKGYAVDEAITILEAAGIRRALLHGGTSSVHALDPPGAGGWRVGWNAHASSESSFLLRNGALSVSASHGKAFAANGREYGHVIDPRDGSPTRAALSAIVTGPRSLECDALSTALLVLGPSWTSVLSRRFPGYRGLAV